MLPKWMLPHGSSPCFDHAARIRRAEADVHRGLEAAGDAAVVLAELALRPVGRDHRGQVVVDAVVDLVMELPL